MNNLIYRLCFLFMILLACKDKKSGIKILNTKNKDGVVISTLSFIQDSVLDGLSTYYYSNGKPQFEYSYKSGKLHGWWMEYYSNGNIKSKGTFKHGMQDGPAYFYFENGTLQHKEFWLNGQIFGSSIWYYPNGLLETYTAIDFQGNKRYKIEYDSFGNKIRDEGKILGQVVTNGLVDSATNSVDGISVNRLFYGKVSVATPPASFLKVYMFVKSDKNKVDSFKLSVDNDMVTFKQVFADTGVHRILFVGEFQYHSETFVKRDSIQISVNVNGTD